MISSLGDISLNHKGTKGLGLFTYFSITGTEFVTFYLSPPLHCEWALERETHVCLFSYILVVPESESRSVVSNSLRSMDYRVHGILQSRILEWEAVPFSLGSSQPRDRTQVSHMAGGFLTSWATRELKKGFNKLINKPRKGLMTILGNERLFHGKETDLIHVASESTKINRQRGGAEWRQSRISFQQSRPVQWQESRQQFEAQDQNTVDIRQDVGLYGLKELFQGSNPFILS